MGPVYWWMRKVEFTHHMLKCLLAEIYFKEEKKCFCIEKLSRCTWVWASSGSWWWTGRPGMMQSMELQGVRHDWVTDREIVGFYTGFIAWKCWVEYAIVDLESFRYWKYLKLTEDTCFSQNLKSRGNIGASYNTVIRVSSKPRCSLECWWARPHVSCSVGITCSKVIPLKVTRKVG